MIEFCSVELESYQKRALPSLSVTNILPNKTDRKKTPVLGICFAWLQFFVVILDGKTLARFGTVNGNIKRFIQFGEAFKRDIYISVKIQDGKSPKNDLSGRYSYVSNKNNADTFVREEFVPSLEKTQFVLLYRNEFWFITNEEYYLGKKKK